MKICLIVPGGVDRSGRERVIPALLWLIERVARQHQLLVITLNQYPEPCSYPLLGARIVNLGQTKTAVPELRFLARWHQLRSLLREEGTPDVIHAFWAQESGLLAGLTGRRLRRPVLVSIGGGELTWHPNIQYGRQGKWRSRLPVTLTLRLATAVTAGSRFVMQGTPHPYHWLPLGVNTNLFSGSPERTPGPPWRLIHVASINRVKDQDTLLQALALARQQLPQIYLDWVGEDTLHGRLQSEAQKLGLAENITFHHFLPHEQLLPLYQRAHLFLQSSLHESQGVAVCEAAACGVPTAGTNVGLVAELAPQAATAVAPGQPADLAAAFLNLLRRPGRRLSLAQQAQSWAQRYDADWTASQFISLYHRLSHGR